MSPAGRASVPTNPVTTTTPVAKRLRAPRKDAASGRAGTGACADSDTDTDTDAGRVTVTRPPSTAPLKPR
ncbi:hypothetical protein ACE1SV_06650 [Streptomyces sennicomposti]